jgi:hypothetical protein
LFGFCLVVVAVVEDKEVIKESGVKRVPMNEVQILIFCVERISSSFSVCWWLELALMLTQSSLTLPSKQLRPLQRTRSLC